MMMIIIIMLKITNFYNMHCFKGWKKETPSYQNRHESIYNWRAHFQNVLNPLLMKIEFLASLYRITVELATEWNLDLDNSRKYYFFFF